MKNKYKIKDKVTEIYIESPKYGHFTVLIDTEDFDLVSKYSWCCDKKYNNDYFYCRSTRKPYISLHRLIMSFPKDKLVDHINHQTLDNRKENLRICINKQNIRNGRKRIDNTSGFKGVSFYINKSGNKYWYSHIKYNNKQIHLGYFPYTEEGKIQAAKRYDQEAKKLFKEYALLNFAKKDN